ncbi:hypothetical protein H8957_017420, partial [Semnopithecus entellus]
MTPCGGPRCACPFFGVALGSQGFEEKPSFPTAPLSPSARPLWAGPLSRSGWLLKPARPRHEPSPGWAAAAREQNSPEPAFPGACSPRPEGAGGKLAEAGAASRGGAGLTKAPPAAATVRVLIRAEEDSPSPSRRGPGRRGAGRQAAYHDREERDRLALPPATPLSELHAQSSGVEQLPEEFRQQPDDSLAADTSFLRAPLALLGWRQCGRRAAPSHAAPWPWWSCPGGPHLWPPHWAATSSTARRAAATSAGRGNSSRCAAATAATTSAAPRTASPRPPHAPRFGWVSTRLWGRPRPEHSGPAAPSPMWKRNTFVL